MKHLYLFLITAALYNLMILYVIFRCLTTAQFNIRVLIGILIAVAVDYIVYFVLKKARKKAIETIKESKISSIEDITFTSINQFNRYEYRKYSYDKVRVFTPEDLIFDRSLIEVGKYITLHQDPSNPYDKNAVAVYRKDTKVGYLYRGKLQDMTNDYLYNHENEVLGFIDGIEDGKFTITLGFYKGSNSFIDDEDDNENDD